MWDTDQQEREQRDELLHEDSDRYTQQSVIRPLEGGVRGQLVTGLERRRRWSPQEKSEILAESFAPGANVSEVARRRDVSLGLLHQWRRAARGGEARSDQSFVPVVRAEAPASSPAASIEVVLGAAVVRVRGRVDRAALEIVIAAARAAL